MGTMIKILKLLTPLMNGQTIEGVPSGSVDSTGRCGLERIVSFQLISNWLATWFGSWVMGALSDSIVAIWSSHPLLLWSTLSLDP